MVSTIFMYAALLLCCNEYEVCLARDTLTYDDPLIDDGSSATLVSAGGTFELGFFSPAGAVGRFVGVWYHKLAPKTVVWVSNRENRLPPGSTGRLTINEGKLCVMDKFGKTYFEAGIEGSASEDKVVKLMETGNLVLQDQMGARTLWQSFQNPTDTFIPGMLMDKSLQLIPWRKENDPGPGSFSFKLDQYNQYIISNKTMVYWKSGESGNNFSPDEMSPIVRYLLSNISSINTGTLYVRHLDFNYTRLVISSSGQLQFLSWNDEQWRVSWSEPDDNCSEFNPCGDFGSCNIHNRPLVCKCLPGFKPVSPEDWNSGVFSDGCDREVKFANNNTFLNLTMMKVREPDLPVSVENEIECSKDCLENTQCVAYSYAEVNPQRGTRNSCWIWLGELNNLVEDYLGGHNLSVRVVSSDTEGPLQVPFSPSSQSSSGENANRKVPFYLIIVAGLIGMILLACVASIYIWRRTTRKKQDKISRAQFDSERRVLELIDTNEFNKEDEKDVFSFGVVLLEIISGRKNAGFYQSKQTFSLICYAWELWTEDKVLDLMDKNLQESCDRIEFIKCVNVALLCVQEDPVDRPTMSNVITLFDSEAASSATPKQPAFFTRRGSSSSASTSTKPESISEITTLEGR